MKDQYERLAWDSDFFGFEVAKITPGLLDELSLSAVLHKLKTSGYRLAYWAIPTQFGEGLTLAKRHNGILVDNKATFYKCLSDSTICASNSIISVVPYKPQSPENDLIQLALESGEYSRFKRDPSFPPELFEKLFTCWIVRAVKREIAWEVLVAQDGKALLGFTSLGSKGTRGDVQLLAVSSLARRRGVGRALVRMAENSFRDKGNTEIQIVTQRDNIAACKLYEACGYQLERSDFIFHFWL